MTTRIRATRRDSISSVIATHKLLELIRANPELFVEDTQIRAALGSQGALARYTNPERGIKAMSLNHQRSVSVVALGGFDLLDDSRKRAKSELVRHLALIAHRPRRATGTKADLKRQINRLEERNLSLLYDLLLLQTAYDRRNAQALHYAKKLGTAMLDRARVEAREIGSMFSPLSRDNASDNVIPIASERRRENRP